jgi:hypothetical protein
MPDVVELWSKALPDIKNAVSGVGVWTALNAAKPVAFEDGNFVIGLADRDSELGGHLKVASTKRLIETLLGKMANAPLTLRVIDGTEPADYETFKRRELERARLQQQSLDKMRTEMTARTSWDQVYEQLGRRYAAVTNKSLPQNRARFFEEAVSLVAEARQGQTNYDDAGERNFARCLERLAQYSEVPSAIVAREVLQRAGEL